MFMKVSETTVVNLENVTYVSKIMSGTNECRRIRFAMNNGTMVECEGEYMKYAIAFLFSIAKGPQEAR